MAFSAVSIAAETIGFVSQKVAELSSLLLWELPKSYARSATVLVDELDPGELQGATDCLIIGRGERGDLDGQLCPANGRHTDGRGASEVLSTPPY